MFSMKTWVYLSCAAAVLMFSGSLSSAQVINCSSDDMKRHYCSADTRGGVTMLKQHSDADCRQGYSWGYDNQGIWVDHGCRGDFQIQQDNYGGGQGSQTINCSSEDMKRHYCSADTRGGVTLVKQRSDAACRQGYSWGYDNKGIWVDRGCRADFQVGQSGYGGYGGQGYARISCSSDDGRRQYCPTDTRGNVSLAERRSGADCRQGYSWGYDDRGIWVDHGCRADFVIEQSWGYHHELPSQTISCNSDDERRHVCPANINGRVRLDQQRSGSPCRLGYSWGFDQSGIWVDHGCRANFVIEQGWQRDWGRDRDRNRDRDSGGDADQFLNCSSEDTRRHYCPADTRGEVRLVKQRSGSECRQGYSWGYDAKGIWVDHGCRADFQIVH